MDVMIASGRSMLEDDVRELVEEKVARLGTRCPGLERATIRFAEEHNPRIPNSERCEVEIVGHGRVVRAHASATSLLAAVDVVVEKLEHQLEKTKGRIVEHARPMRPRARLAFGEA